MLDRELLKKGGLDAETIDKLCKAKEKEKFEAKYKTLFTNVKVKALVGLAKGLDFPVKITVTGTGKHDQDPTLKISCPGKSSGKGGNGQAHQIKVGGKIYPSGAEYCRQHDIDPGAGSAIGKLDILIAAGSTEHKYEFVTA